MTYTVLTNRNRQRTSIHLFGGIFIACAVIMFLFRPPAAMAVTIAPSFIDTKADPGMSGQINLTISNPDTEKKTLQFDVEDLTYTSDGTPRYSTEQIPGSMRQWLKEEGTDVEIGPRQRRTVSFRLVVPKGALPGGHYAAIVISETTRITAGNPADIGVIPKIAIPLYLEVTGEVTRRFSIGSFESVRRYYGNFPIVFTMQVINTGSVHLTPHGVITLSHPWTGNQMGTVIVNEDSAYVLPKHERRFMVSWPEGSGRVWDPRWWGMYQAHLELAAAGAERRTAEARFWVLPVRQMSIEFVITAGLMFLTVRLVRKLIRRVMQRRTNRHEK